LRGTSFVGDLKIRRPQPELAWKNLRLDGTGLVADGKSAKKIDEIPALLGFEHVGKGRHGASFKAVADPPVDVASGMQGGVRGREIGGLQVDGHGRSQRAVAMSAYAMASRAIVFVVLEACRNRGRREGDVGRKISVRIGLHGNCGKG